MPVDPTLAVTGPEWAVPSLGADGPAAAPAAGDGDGFGAALSRQVERLSDLQSEAAAASRDLATGQATDPASVVMAVERARLGMQLAAQLRTKGVEAIQTVFNTQV